MSIEPQSLESEIRVAGSTPTKQLAGSVASLLREGHKVTLVGIGHQAVGQAVKAIPVVNAHLANKAWIYTILPSLEDRVIEEEGRTVTRTVTVMRLIRYDFR